MPSCSTPPSPTSTVRRPEADVRVRIFGPLEARLQSVDRLVLGGLVEGVWPPETRGDPWLSRPMRHELGLDLPERRIGLSAHDFAQALGAPEVILTRAAKLGGAPTVASRFVQRLAAVAGEARWDAALERGARYVDAGARSSTSRQRAEARSRGPSRSRRSRRGRRQLSVTEIEHWLRDPYTIYAKHMLQACSRSTRSTRRRARADRGTVIHDAIGEFTKTVRGQAARRSGRRADRASASGISQPLDGLSRGARVLVAALPAHRRTGSPASRPSAAPGSRSSHAEIGGSARNPARRRRCSS